MGMLILTKSTRRLIRKFSREFRSPRISFYRQPANRQWFDTPQTNNPYYLLDVCDHFDIYPNPHTSHPKLRERWRYFLRYELGTMMHGDIREAIKIALGDPSYQYILFDTLESVTQMVIWSAEFESGNNDDTTDGAKYMKIVLVTPLTQAPADPPPFDKRRRGKKGKKKRPSKKKA